MHSTPNPSRVGFTGPLALFAHGLEQELAELGYTTTTATAVLQLAAHLSRWLEAQGLGPADLAGPVLGHYLAARRAACRSRTGPRALDPVMMYLRRVSAAPEPVSEPPRPGAAAVLLSDFAGYLTGERGLTAPVAEAYVRWVRPFTETVLCRDGGCASTGVTATEVGQFLAAALPALPGKSAQMTACALRSLLRFPHATGIAERDLADAVPRVARWRLSGLPKALAAEQVQALRAACDPADLAGCRDLAVIACLHRLGLRCGEAAALRLEDIDWQAGTVTVRGKGNRTDRLPLPADVGEALVAYLTRARPATTARSVFVTAKAPVTGLGRSGISCIVGRAAKRAGLGTVHAHRLRHTTATATLNAGASLAEVAQLMRHAGPAATFVYAKTDQRRLGALARPWPAAGNTR